MNKMLKEVLDMSSRGEMASAMVILEEVFCDCVHIINSACLYRRAGKQGWMRFKPVRVESNCSEGFGLEVSVKILNQVGALDSIMASGEGYTYRQLGEDSQFIRKMDGGAKRLDEMEKGGHC